MVKCVLLYIIQKWNWIMLHISQDYVEQGIVLAKHKCLKQLTHSTVLTCAGTGKPVGLWCFQWTFWAAGVLLQVMGKRFYLSWSKATTAPMGLLGSYPPQYWVPDQPSSSHLLAPGNSLCPPPPFSCIGQEQPKHLSPSGRRAAWRDQSNFALAFIYSLVAADMHHSMVTMSWACASDLH